MEEKSFEQGFSFQHRRELKKVLKRLDRIRIKGEKSHTKELNDLRQENELDGDLQCKLGLLEQCKSWEEFSHRLWYWELEIDDELGNVFLKDSLIARTFSQLELAIIIEEAAESNSFKYDEAFFGIFDKLLIKWRENNTRKVLVPITFDKDVPILPPYLTTDSASESLSQINQLSEQFTLLTRITDHNSLVQLLRNQHSITPEDFEHMQKTTNEVITNNPVIVFEIESSFERERDRAIDKFNWFKSIVDFFSSYYGIESSALTKLSGRNRKDRAKHFFSLKGDTLERYPQNTDCSFQFSLEKDTFAEIKKDKHFSIVLDSYKNFDCKVLGKLHNSLHFFSKAKRDSDNIDKFLGYIFSIEAVCSIDNKNISERLANFVSNSQRASNDDLFKAMKKIYGLRSRIVHEGHRFIGSNSVRQVEELALVSIYKALELYVQLSEGKYEIDWKKWCSEIETLSSPSDEKLTS